MSDSSCDALLVIAFTLRDLQSQAPVKQAPFLASSVFRYLLSKDVYHRGRAFLWAVPALHGEPGPAINLALGLP